MPKTTTDNLLHWLDLTTLKIVLQNSMIFRNHGYIRLKKWEPKYFFEGGKKSGGFKKKNFS